MVFVLTFLVIVSGILFGVITCQNCIVIVCIMFYDDHIYLFDYHHFLFRPKPFHSFMEHWLLFFTGHGFCHFFLSFYSVCTICCSTFLRQIFLCLPTIMLSFHVIAYFGKQSDFIKQHVTSCGNRMMPQEPWLNTHQGAISQDKELLRKTHL